MNAADLQTPSRPVRAIEVLLLAHAALLPISIAAGQVWAYLVAVLSIAAWRFGRLDAPARSPLFAAIMLYIGTVLFSAVVGVRPALAWDKMDRLLLLAVPLVLPLLPGMAHAASMPDIPRRLLQAFLIGCSAKAIYDCLRIPIQHVLRLRAYTGALQAGVEWEGPPPSLFDLGSMRDPQFYAVAVCVAVALWISRTPGFSRRWLAAGALLSGVATFLHFKRGAWLALGISLLVMMLMSRRRWLVLVLVAAALAAPQVPVVRARLSLLQEELQLRTGGRFALWTRVAPSLFREYPLGMGWRSVQHTDLLKQGAPVQAKLNHLHNNVLHVRLETGLAGLLAWLNWMGVAFVLLWRAWRRACQTQSEWTGPALGLFTSFLALHVNGLVEYNFGDGEIFMLLNLVMGLGAAGWAMQRYPPMAGARAP